MPSTTFDKEMLVTVYAILSGVISQQKILFMTDYASIKVEHKDGSL